MQPGHSLGNTRACNTRENNEWSVTEWMGFSKMEMSEKHTPSVSQIWPSLGLGDNSAFPKYTENRQEVKGTPTYQLVKENLLSSIHLLKEEILKKFRHSAQCFSKENCMKGRSSLFPSRVCRSSITIFHLVQGCSQNNHSKIKIPLKNQWHFIL